jgi:RNA polymerase sigma factor (sigma-70 family)
MSPRPAPYPRKGHVQPGPDEERVRRLHVVGADEYLDWESVYRDNVERLYRLMYSRVGNRPDAEDLTAEVFRTALPPLRLSASKGEVRAYLLMTARTVLAGHWRRRLGQAVTTIDPEVDMGFLDSQPSAAPPGDTPDRVERILAGLPERYRRILELRFLEGSPIKETARLMEISVGNAKVLQHRALHAAATIASQLEEER